MDFDDYRAINALVLRYAAAVDAGDFDQVGELFADAELTMPGADQPIRSNSAAVAAMYRRAVRVYPDTGTPKTRHLVANFACTPIGADWAQATSAIMVSQSTDDFPLQVIACASYEDSFARIEGQWRFARRRITMDQLGDTSHHLNR
ncbi:nuclear transport factor 2 family protein [Nocardia sp. NPDC051756]|uniref:nuclear transport factor 2 family protein n=1 Tax=Nocardia sp. NPDC051756 TaxID=3154751 RepID=UPI00343B2D3E